MTMTNLLKEPDSWNVIDTFDSDQEIEDQQSFLFRSAVALSIKFQAKMNKQWLTDFLKKASRNYFMNALMLKMVTGVPFVTGSTEKCSEKSFFFFFPKFSVAFHGPDNRAVKVSMVVTPLWRIRVKNLCCLCSYPYPREPHFLYAVKDLDLKFRLF